MACDVFLYDLYRRYHLQASVSPDIAAVPSRFRVRVKKRGLASLILKELIQYRGNKAVVLSRPCVYGVFSGPVGGFAPRDHLCVGCLRCTTQYPEFVQIYPNPERKRLGDSYFTPDYVETLHYEARTGRVPVKGAGYRGRFGGEGWNGMWTDMSEIVRPTRDGIHGREFISTAVDIGPKPSFLSFDEHGRLKGNGSTALSLPIPLLFDAPPAAVLSERLARILAAAAQEAETLAILPISALKKFGISGEVIVPLVTAGEGDAVKGLPFEPRMIELDGWDEELHRQVQTRFPKSIVCIRWNAISKEDVQHGIKSGIRVFHLALNYHGRGTNGQFALDLIRDAHTAFVETGCRDEVTLLGSGGIVAAEHVPKAIIRGLDAVVLDTAVLVALQAQFVGDCTDRHTSQFQLPTRLELNWGVQRAQNLLSSWRDQLLEVMGAMGLREVRRMRGEIGRAMFETDLEREAFSGIEGYGA
jgi:hypothetical protein